ncbi:MAG: phytoene desaturase family protein [Solirubrobacteraceae bacterium]
MRRARARRARAHSAAAMKYDVVVVGAGTAGLVCASVLAQQGRRVALVERHRYLGGRAMEHRFRGHQLGLGSHLVEDPGDSLTRACELIGVTLTHSERSDSMPFWQGDRWIPIQQLYDGASKRGLKQCIEALTQTSFEELDSLDHLSLREWMRRFTNEEGVFQVWEAISILEQITDKWYDHSASENLYVRKLHYERKRTAGYSFWPIGGWEQLWRQIAARFGELGGTLIQPATVERVLVADGRVQGVRLRAGAEAGGVGAAERASGAAEREAGAAEREAGAAEGESHGSGAGETIEAEQVVVSAPVWDLPRIFDHGVLPWNLLQRVRMLASNRNKACWIGYWIAAEEPVIASSEREMASFAATPRTGLGGFTLNFTGYDPGVSPPGEYLTCVGAAFDATQHYGQKAWIERKFHELWLDIEEMLPAAKGALWKKPHLVTTYGVINKPGLVGAVRPDAEVREIEGLWLTGDTTRSRGIGIDKAARTGITAAERVLGRRLPFFGETVRY